MLENNKLTITDSSWKLIVAINKTANKIPYKTDKELYNKDDYWTAKLDEIGAGDCDDYMLYKRKLLIKNNIPWQCLLLATCSTPEGGHAVLLVRTTKGVYVLDNNTDKIKRIEYYRSGGKKVKWLDWFDPVDQQWYSF